MPELPEVQTTVNGINRYLKGLVIKDVWTNYRSPYHKGKDNIKNPRFFRKFKKEVVGKKIIGAERRAKNVIINLSGGSVILVHMEMAGHLLYGAYKRNPKSKILNPKREEWVAEKKGPLQDPFNRFIRFLIKLSNGKCLALSDMRRFAKITHIHKDELAPTLHLDKLGPEPLAKNFGAKIFRSRLALRPNMKIKQALMNQALISGIGNIYSDEILWRAGIHPVRKVKSIKPEEFKKIYRAMRTVLKAGIDFGGDSMSDYRNILGKRGRFQERHNAYRRTGQKCRRPGCNGIIRRIVIGARSAHFCDKHQK